MRVLTVFAHHNPRSFCRAALDAFSEGVAAAGHSHEIVDLHAIRWNPVLTERDSPNWVDDTVPDDVLQYMHVAENMRKAAARPLQRFLVERFIAGLDARGILRKVRARGGPRDVAEQQAKLARADALVLISPVYFMGFPAILKGWIDRVLSLGFAFGFKPEAWRGDVSGRLPLLKTKKALVINTTIFDEATYDAGHRAAMQLLIDDYCLRYPGIAEVHHEYFYAVHGADDATRRRYLERAYQLGRELFAAEVQAPLPAEAAATAAQGL